MLFVERMWLMVAIICIVLAAARFLLDGADGFHFLLFSAVAFLFHFIRKNQRRRWERRNNEESK